MIARLLFATLGWMFTALAIVGIALPMLPTTPFLLLAAWCFDRSSPRMHAWLLRQPILGRIIVDWRAHGVIRTRAKVVATLAMGVLAAWAASRDTTPPWAIAAMLAVMAATAAFIWTRPSAPRRINP